MGPVKRQARLLVMAACMLPASVAPATAYAQPASALDPTVEEGRARFAEGLKLAEAGDHNAARIKFDQAWTVLKLPGVLFNLARAEQLSGHLTESLQHHRAFARTPAGTPKVTDAMRKTAEENIAALAAKLGQIEIDAPARARISIDGYVLEGSTLDPIPVTPGRHVVEATVDGKTRSVTVECPAGSVTPARLVEAPAPAPPPQKPGATPRAAPGSSSLFTTRNVVGSGLGVIAIGAGTTSLVFLLDSNSKVNDAKDFDTSQPGGACRTVGVTCDAYATRLDDARSSRTIAQAAAVGAGVLAVASLAVFALWPFAKGRIEPTVGGLGGSF